MNYTEIMLLVVIVVLSFGSTRRTNTIENFEELLTELRKINVNLETLATPYQVRMKEMAQRHQFWLDKSERAKAKMSEAQPVEEPNRMEALGRRVRRFTKRKT